MAQHVLRKAYFQPESLENILFPARFSLFARCASKSALRSASAEAQHPCDVQVSKAILLPTTFVSVRRAPRVVTLRRHDSFFAAEAGLVQFVQFFGGVPLDFW